MKFASSFGFITVLTLLATYVELLDPSGVEIGLFVTALGVARFVGIVPLGWAGDRYDKYNAVRMAAGIGGTLGAGALYDLYGFTPIVGLLAGRLALATLGVFMTTFRAQYAVGVTLVRNWVPILVSVSAARGGLGIGSAFVVGLVIAAEKFTNMLCQPYTGRLSDRYGRALFVFVGSGADGLVALSIPFAVSAGSWLGLGSLAIPSVGTVPAAVPIVVVLNGLLGVADSIREPASMALFADEGKSRGIASRIGIRSLVWRPGAIAAPMVGGWLMTTVGMDWVIFLAGAAALSGVLTVFGVLSYSHGSRALTRW